MTSSRLAMEASGWRGEAEGFEGLGGGVELAEAAVDEDERGDAAAFRRAGGGSGAWTTSRMEAKSSTPRTVMTLNLR